MDDLSYSSLVKIKKSTKNQVIPANFFDENYAFVNFFVEDRSFPNAFAFHGSYYLKMIEFKPFNINFQNF